MKAKDLLLCCDWGTSNFRIFLVDVSSGNILGSQESGQGNAQMFASWQASGTERRIGFYRNYLQEQIDRLAQTAKIELSDIPVFTSGMSSSSIGMKALPYVTLPFDLRVPELGCQHIEATEDFPNEIFLFTGLKTEEDVMRGEEVQQLGLHPFVKKDRYLCILPGTHSKHILVEDHQLVDFQTFMTGECFELLSKHSILKNSVSKGKPSTDNNKKAFENGVGEGLKSQLLNSLFKIRSNDLLKAIPPTESYSFLSGLLIGSELSKLEKRAIPIIICGNRQLKELYEIALSTMGKENLLLEIPATAWEKATILGQIQLAKKMNKM